MRQAAGSAGAIVQLAGHRFGECHELQDGLGGRRRRHDHQRGNAGDHGHRREVAQHVVVHARIEKGREHVTAGHQHQAVAVGRRARRDLGADIAGRAGLVVDDELLAEAGREPLRHLPRRDIGCAAGDERHDDAHRPVGILRLGRTRRQQAGHHREERQAFRCKRPREGVNGRGEKPEGVHSTSWSHQGRTGATQPWATERRH